MSDNASNYQSQPSLGHIHVRGPTYEERCFHGHPETSTGERSLLLHNQYQGTRPAEWVCNAPTTIHDNWFSGPSELVPGFQSPAQPLSPFMEQTQTHRSPNFGESIYSYTNQPDIPYHQPYKNFNVGPVPNKGFQLGGIQLATQDQLYSPVGQPTQASATQGTSSLISGRDKLPFTMTVREVEEILGPSKQETNSSMSPSISLEAADEFLKRSKQAFFNSGNEHLSMEHDDNPHNNNTASFEVNVRGVMEQGTVEQSVTTPEVASKSPSCSYQCSNAQTSHTLSKRTRAERHYDVNYYRDLCKNRHLKSSVSALMEINKRSESRPNFAANLNRCLFSESVRKTSNVRGVQEKKKLDPKWIGVIKDIVFEYRQLEPGKDYAKEWSLCRKAIDAANRKLNFEPKKKQINAV